MIIIMILTIIIYYYFVISYNLEGHSPFENFFLKSSWNTFITTKYDVILWNDSRSEQCTSCPKRTPPRWANRSLTPKNPTHWGSSVHLSSQCCTPWVPSAWTLRSIQIHQALVVRSNRSPSSQLYREFIASLSSEPLSGSTFTQVHPTSKQDRIANRVSETTTSARTYASIPRSKSNSAKQPHHATYTTPCFLFPSFFFSFPLG